VQIVSREGVPSGYFVGCTASLENGRLTVMFRHRDPRLHRVLPVVALDPPTIELDDPQNYACFVARGAVATWGCDADDMDGRCDEQEGSHLGCLFAPQWADMARHYANDAEAGQALKADPKVLARLRSRTPVPKSALLKMLHRLAERHNLDHWTASRILFPCPPGCAKGAHEKLVAFSYPPTVLRDSCYLLDHGK
jgi:hypothetical protein